VYDLSSPSYSLLYCLPAAGITDVKLGSSYMLLVKEAVTKRQQQEQRQQESKEACSCTAVLPLEVLSAVNGMVSSSRFDHSPTQGHKQHFDRGTLDVNVLLMLSTNPSVWGLLWRCCVLGS
jgi:hypothetical protein